MKRVGTVLTFAQGVSLAKAEKALTKFVKDNPGLLAEEQMGFNFKTKTFIPAKEFRLNEYDDEYGGPVWYIP